MEIGSVIRLRTIDRIKKNSEVFTPLCLVDRILANFPDKIWFDPTNTWLEPSCGEGNFLILVLKKLMSCLEEWQPDNNKRHEHIIERMLFGIDLMQDNVDICINRLNAGHLKHHIVCANALTYHYRFDEKTILKPSDEIFLWPP
jgi:hypothetical protein